MMDISSPGATDMVATNTSPDLGHSRPNTQLRLLKTKQRWNLRNMQAFPMWKDELYDLLRIALPDQFVETPRPTVDSLTSYSELSHTRKTVKLKSSDLAALEAMTTAWDYYNGILFCIVKNSVELTESRIKHVHDNYGVASKGQEFLEYVRASTTRVNRQAARPQERLRQANNYKPDNPGRAGEHYGLHQRQLLEDQVVDADNKGDGGVHNQPLPV